MTKKELKAKTTDELLRLQASDKKIAIERINEGLYNIEREGLSLCGHKVIGCDMLAPRTQPF